jgi:hypothetical protein
MSIFLSTVAKSWSLVASEALRWVNPCEKNVADGRIDIGGERSGRQKHRPDADGHDVSCPYTEKGSGMLVGGWRTSSMILRATPGRGRDLWNGRLRPS